MSDSNEKYERLSRRHDLSKEKLVEAIRQCAEKVGGIPTFLEFRKNMGIPRRNVLRVFGSYSQALRAAGMERNGPGRRLSADELFRDWAALVRSIGEIPRLTEYEAHSKYSSAPLVRRYRGWRNVVDSMVQYARENGLETEFADVLEIVQRGRTDSGRLRQREISSRRPVLGPGFLQDRPVCGASLTGVPMGFAPTNEAGVLFLFGAVANQLGFFITSVGVAFPDVEGFREVAPGKWQYVRIEVEFESKNFARHMHDVEGCDLIVCWENNWEDCPLPVVELRGAISTQQLARKSGDPVIG